MKILILSASPGSQATQSIVSAGEERGHEMLVINPEYAYLLISDVVNGYDRVYHYDPADLESKPDRINAKEIDAIIPRIGTNLSYASAVLEHLNHNLGIFSTQTAIGIKTAADKLISLQKISQAKLKVPKTVLGDQAVHPAWMIDQVGKLPAIAKELKGSQGKTVYPLMDAYQSNVFLENFAHKNENLLLQKFIDGGNKDIRAIVINGEVVAAMERTAKKGELRANISRGGSGKKIDLSEEDQGICLRAASACGLLCAGVDLMKDKDGNSYVIEVNGNYGYYIQDITGIDISTPLIKCCENYYKSGSNMNKLSTYIAFVDEDISVFLSSANSKNTSQKEIPEKTVEESSGFLSTLKRMRNDSVFSYFLKNK